MMNVFVGIGRLTRDPELRYTPQGVPVASFAIAVERPFTNAQGNKEVDFIDCVAWRKLGEVVGNHLSKGRLVAVEGRLQIRSYEAQDGTKRKVAEIVAKDINFLDGKKSNGAAAESGSASEPDAAIPDDLPF